MDDLALLDLLECPVCFEKLDASAKVLPCQHTFCKPCLQRILKSQKELRCPECRTLVLGSIEQLPSNLLLIRLLDGVRCGQNAGRFGSVQRSGVLSSPASIRRVPRGLQLHQHRLATNPRIHMEGVPRARALYSYRGHNPGELRFNKVTTLAFSKASEITAASQHAVDTALSTPGAGQVMGMLVHPQLSSSGVLWAQPAASSPARLNRGAPSTASSLSPSPVKPQSSGMLQPPCRASLPALTASLPRCVALHSYAAHGPDELELQKGEGVRVFGKEQDGWLRGMSLVTGRVGLFPSNYVSPLFRKSSLTDSKMPSLYTSWTLSTSSLSSQGSVPEGGPRQSRALRPLLLPVPIPCPGRAPAPLRRGRGSARRNGSLQRPGQAGTPVQITGSLRRPSAAGRAQHFQLYPHSVPGTDETERPNPSYEGTPALLVRGGESRSPSVCSSVILDAKEPSVKSEAAPKPPASAPPSILVKPETSRNSAEKPSCRHRPPSPDRRSCAPSKPALKSHPRFPAYKPGEGTPLVNGDSSKKDIFS
uniref:SH3 domain containing ring finger 2 n=1 Tax=Zonotrichia albicollis TaxID=44394 RepID=A0A8D2N8L1_ZONAL